MVKLSVVMAVRNGEPYVREAIESVLAQSVTDFEFLVVDDASTDNTPGILSGYQRQDSRIHVLHNERNLGPYPSANRALRDARGSCIARHDADDVSLPKRFAIQLDALDHDQDVSLVTGAFEVFDGNGGHVKEISRPPSWQPRLEWELLFTNAVGAGAHVMFPRLVRGTPVLFPERYLYAGDYELWCSLSRLGRVACPTDVIYRYRQHGLSITSRNGAEQYECLSKIRREYQSQYRQSDVSDETVEEVSRFWIADGRRSLAASLPGINSTLTELRAHFLAYIEQRYGFAERSTLEAELDDAMSDRLGYWLYRSIRLLDGRACRDLLSLAGARRQALNVSSKAFKWITDSFLRKLRRGQP
jgi:glycosyltransferase involved in cell wall biosynthesis